MIKKKLTRLIGLKKEEFDLFVQSGQIQVQPARLIPVLKVGDEMALTSIFLSSLRLISDFGANFASTKKFIELIEKMVLNYYEGVVQHMTNWNRPAPKLNH